MYKSLLEYAETAKQKKAVQACINSPSQRVAAEKLGINKRTLERTLEKVRDNRVDHEKSKAGRVHCFIPDTQVTPDTPNDHLIWAGHYIKEEKPDVVVQIGDWADMEALSSYDQGKKAAEGRRVVNDFDSANKAMNAFMQPINESDHTPELHLTLGNHEYRIQRAVECDAKLDGFLSMDSLNFKDHGWNVYDFLTPVDIDGVWYAHYYANAMSGRPIGGTNINTRLNNIGFSFSMGHQQMHMAGSKNLNNGKVIRGLVSGAFYLHDEEYKGQQGNTHFRGLTMKHEVRDGNYDIMEVSLDYLCRRYEGIPLHRFMEKKYPDIYSSVRCT